MNLLHFFVSEDKVWLDAHNLYIKTLLKKLSHWRIEPYPIQQQQSSVIYCLQLPKSMKINNVFHVNLMTLYCETNAYGLRPTQPPPELIEEEKEYKIKEIIDD
jgi:hypothetical protein